MKPDTSKIDTRGSPEQRKALLDAVEVAHGARVLALRDVDRAITDAVNEECTCGGSGPGESTCVACAVYHRFKAALAQSGAAPKGEQSA